MKTILTKTMRDEIVCNVMNSTNLPEERKQIEERAKALAREIIITNQPSEFLKMAERKPVDWFKLQNELRVKEEHNPFNVFGQHDNPDAYARYYRIWSVSLNDPVPIAYIVLLSEHESKQHFGPLRREAEAWAEQWNEAALQLRGLLNSCRTVEALLEKAPELAPHVPKKEQKSFPLVSASNMLSTLTKLGFDKNAK